MDALERQNRGVLELQQSNRYRQGIGKELSGPASAGAGGGADGQQYMAYDQKKDEAFNLNQFDTERAGALSGGGGLDDVELYKAYRTQR